MTLPAKRVLLVEQDDRLFFMLRSILEEAGYALLGPPAPLFGAWVALPQHIDVALIDVYSGTEHMASLESLELQLTARNVPVLLITQNASAVLADRPAYRPLAKPFTQEQLIERLEETLQQSAADNSLH